MYHIRLAKGLSYSGAVTATRQHPDVFTESEEEYTSAMKSGYFKDLTGTERKTKPSKEEVEECGIGESDVESLEECDAFEDMNVDELKAYAEASGISLAGAKKKADILGTIREAEARAADARNILRGER